MNYIFSSPLSESWFRRPRDFDYGCFTFSFPAKLLPREFADHYRYLLDAPPVFLIKRTSNFNSY